MLKIKLPPLNDHLIPPQMAAPTSWTEKNLFEKRKRNNSVQYSTNVKFVLPDMPPLQPGFSKGLAEFLSRTELLTSQRRFKALPGARLLQQPAVYSARDTSQHPLHPVSTQHPDPALWCHPSGCPSHPPGSPVPSFPRASTHTPLSLDVRLPFPTCFPTWPAVHL